MNKDVRRAACLLLAGLLIVGCSKQPDKQPDKPSQNAAQSASLPADKASNKHYKIDISRAQLPSDAAPLTATLRQVIDQAKREFLQALPDPKKFPEFANQQMTLTLDFKQVAQTARFLSIRENGGEYTGGAHPIPIEASFVYDRKRQQVISLATLFNRPDAARQQLANFARQALIGQLDNRAHKVSGTGAAAWRENSTTMINAGTRATAANFSYFVVRAGADDAAPSPGISLIFPTYQVAAYVAGPQVVEVPASVFAALLKPDYKNAFASGT